MDEINNNFPKDENEEIKAIPEQDTQEVIAENNKADLETDIDEAFYPDGPVLNPITFTPVKAEENDENSKKGLVIFAVIMAFVILLTGAVAVGYHIGQNDFEVGYGINQDIDFPLAERPADGDIMTAAEVYEAVNPSVVGVVAYNDSVASQCSGIVFSNEGYIITNDHIYAHVPAAKFKIYTYDGKELSASFVAGDVVSDLAVLKVENANLKPANFGNSDNLYCGEHVVAIGRPKNATVASSITQGIISALNRRITSTTNYSSRVIQTDTAINPGSSGGALVNMHGQIVGVTSAKMASADYEGTGYAIPTTVVQRIVSELIAKGEITTRAKLGITYNMIDSLTAEISEYKQIGIRISQIDGSSALYGKAESGDTITHINGVKITKAEIMLDVIDKCRAGDLITITIVKPDGTSKNIEVKLSANVSQSSYKTVDDTDNSSSSSGGAFDFPFGE